MFANDSDIGLNGLVTYELMNHKDKFRIDAFTGSISTKSGIVVNDEENVVYDLSVVASDRGRPALRYMVKILFYGNKTIQNIKKNFICW